MSRTASRRNTLFFGACCAAYVISAMYLNTYGADAPLMMSWYNVDSGTQGLLLTLQSVGGTAASFFFMAKGDTLNKMHVIAIGLALLAAGCMAMGLGPQFYVLGLIAPVCGCGFDCIDVMVNGVLTDVYPQRKNTLLSVVHAVYGAGAMLAPALVALIVNPDQPRSFGRPFLMNGTVAACVLVLYLVCARPIYPVAPYRNMSAQVCQVRRSGQIFRSKTAWILLVAAILYFSFQMGVSAWLPTFGLEVGIPYESASLLASGFFGGALVMGFLSALLLKRMSARSLFGWFGIGSAACMAMAACSTSGAMLTTLVILSGFCQGAGVSTLVIVLVDAFPEMSAAASSVQVTGANIGAITAPLWVGAMADATGFRVPFLIACALYVAGALLVLLFAPGGRLHRATTQAVARAL